MPKKIKSLSGRLNTFVSEFGGNVFSIDSKVLFCKYCETKIDSERRSSVIQHLKTKKHFRSVKRKEDRKETKCQQLLHMIFRLKNQSSTWIYAKLWSRLIYHLINYQI